MARRSLYYDYPLSLRPAHGPSLTLLPGDANGARPSTLGIVVQQVDSTPHMPLGDFGTRFIPCPPDSNAHILAYHRPASEPIRATTLQFHGHGDGIWAPRRALVPGHIAAADAGGRGPLGGEFSLDITWGNPRYIGTQWGLIRIPSVSVTNWSGSLRILSEDHDPRHDAPNSYPITPDQSIFLPFATCLRIRYAPGIAAQLGHTGEPESRLAVSFMHIATQSPGGGLLWLERPDYWNIGLAAGAAGNFWRDVLRSDPTQASAQSLRWN